jgi:hypothetical protein
LTTNGNGNGNGNGRALSPMQIGNPVTYIHNDISAFGIGLEDIDARPLTQLDVDSFRLKTPAQGYKIHYYDIHGKILPHFRIRKIPTATDAGGFISQTGKTACIYYPQDFQNTVTRTLDNVIFVVDDERLATQLCLVHDVPAVAIQGPTGWRATTGVADGFADLVEFASAKNYTIVLWIGNGLHHGIQTQVALLGFELKFSGVSFSKIRQYVGNKFKEDALHDLLAKPSAFPRHPSIRKYIQDKIGDDGEDLTRKDRIEISMAVIADMESHGMRIKSTTDGQYYYFDNLTKELMCAYRIAGRNYQADIVFLNFIYHTYGLSSNDHKIMGWISSLYMAENPIQETKSHKILMCEPRKHSRMAIQISDSEFVYFDQDHATGKPVQAKIVTNGTNNILFERKGVQPVDSGKLQSNMYGHRTYFDTNGRLPMWWRLIVNQMRLDASIEFKTMLALLYYVSPWLRGWKNIQLPIEVVTGEAGSGKSSLFVLRMSILSGIPNLQKLPSDIRSWETQIINTSGIAVMDNVHLSSQAYMQQLSDEMCRIVTDPDPTIDTRVLFTTSELAKFPVNCTFGITSISNVFTKYDFNDRSIITRLDKTFVPAGAKSADIVYGEWVAEQLDRFGGREAWLAHHIVALEKFFEIAAAEWDHDYKSKSRLIHLEQALITMGKVFDIDAKDWLPKLFQETVAKSAVFGDDVLEGLFEFTLYWNQTHKKLTLFTAAHIAEWASESEDYTSNETLINSRKLGKYMAVNKSAIRHTTKIKVERTSPKGTLYSIEK